VTIGFPVYNGEAFLEEALQSVLSQSFEDFELLIADNASTDRTPAICEAVAGADARVRYVRHKTNIGASPNFNFVINQAHGDYFRVAHHDDVLEPGCLEACVSVLDSSPEVVLAFTQSVTIDQEGKVLPRDRSLPYQLLQTRPSERFDFSLSTFLFKRREGMLNAVFGLMRTLDLVATGGVGSYMHGDHILLSQMALRGFFMEFPETLFRRRDHPDRSMRVHQHSNITDWIDPIGGKAAHNSLIFREFLAAIRRAPIVPSEKIRATRILATRFSQFYAMRLGIGSPRNGH